MANTEKNFTDVEKALIIASLKLSIKSTDRAAANYTEQGKHATARTLHEESRSLQALVDKVRAF